MLEHADFAAEYKSLLPEGNGFIPVPHSSLIRFRQSCHHPHQAGFSRPVCPAQQCQFTLLDFQLIDIQDDTVLKNLLDAIEADQGLRVFGHTEREER